MKDIPFEKIELSKIIDKYKEDINFFASKLFDSPELGYKEVKTKKLIIEELSKHNISVTSEYLITGFSVSIGEGKTHIGLIAELDAVVTKNHPNANEIDNAAHSCGHFSQVAIMVYVLIGLKESNVLKSTKVTLFFTPAEEYVDLEYRQNLIKQGKIKHIGGKINMLQEGIFNGVDCIIHLHSMSKGYAFGYNSSLAGFMYKKIKFLGKASHSAVAPHLGVNALNSFTLFNSALGMLRETFLDNEMTRVHGILTKGGESINAIPSEVVYECYIRSLNYNRIIEISNQLTKTSKHCAQALNGDVEIIDEKGYLPFIPNKNLGNLIYKNMLYFAKEEEIISNELSIASGYVGDVSLFYPMVQFGYSGFSGNFHGCDFKMDDSNRGLIEPCKIVLYSIFDLINDKGRLEEIKSSFKPLMSIEDYLQYLNS